MVSGLGWVATNCTICVYSDSNPFLIIVALLSLQVLKYLTLPAT